MVVIGAGFGGLSCAIRLARAGARVAILEKNAKVGGRANRLERGEWRWDTGPTLLNYPWVFEALFHGAGSELRDAVELKPLDPSVEFCWPDGSKLALSSDLPRLYSELERLEPGVGPRLFRWLADAEFQYDFAFRKLVSRDVSNPIRWFGALTPREMWATAVWRSMDRQLSRYFRQRRVVDALGSYAMYLGGSPRELPGLFSILPYGELAHGLWYPRGGVYALTRAIADLAARSGVEVLTDQPVHEIQVSAGRARGVVTRDGRFWPADAVVSNVDVPTTWACLLDARAPGYPWRQRRLRGLRMTPGVVTFYWGIRRRPAGWPHHTIFLPEEPREVYWELAQGRIPEEPAFYMAVPSASDADAATPEGEPVFVLVPVPNLQLMGERHDWRAAIDVLRGRVRTRLRKHGWELTDDMTVIEEVFDPPRWRDAFGLYQGSAFGAAHTLWQLGPFRPPLRDPHITGLYYVGASTVPGTGLPLVVLGGAMTARAVALALG